MRRTLWQSQLTESEQVVRRIFRAAYGKPYTGKTVSAMNQKERIARDIRSFIERRYDMRFNVVKHGVEFRRHDQVFKPWQPLDKRDINRIAFEEMEEGGEGCLSTSSCIRSRRWSMRTTLSWSSSPVAATGTDGVTISRTMPGG